MSGTDRHARYTEALDLVEDFIHVEDLDRALALFEGLAEDEAAAAAVYAGYSKALWIKYRAERDEQWLPEAEAMARKALDKGPFLAAAHASLGVVLLAQRRTEAGLGALEEALRLDPTCVDAHLGFADHYEQTAQIELAEQAYRRVLEVEPRGRRALDRFGALLFNAARLDEAEALFERSIEVAPTNVFGYGNLAGVAFMRGDLDKAAAILQQGLEIAEHSYLYSNLGTILFYQGRYEASIEPFRRAVEVDQGVKDHLSWANLGDAYRWTPGYEREMSEAYERAISLVSEEIQKSPVDLTLRAQRALYKARSGAWGDAVAEARAVEASGELSAQALYLLTGAYEQAGERASALAALGRAFELGYPAEP
ncbi:MAG: tetratricopeptide repeat protein, partial [Acidobacteriota bacterium]